MNNPLRLLPRTNKRIVLAVTLLLAILLLDIFLPLEIYVDTLFIFCMFLIIKETRKTILIFSLLTLISFSIVFVLEVGEYTHLSQYINRIVSLITIVFAAALAIKYSKLQSQHIKSQEQRIKSLENILFMTSHKVRIPVTNITGLSSLLDNPGLRCEDLVFITEGMKDSVILLDDFTKELSAYIYSLKEKENTNPVSLKAGIRLKESRRMTEALALC